MDHLIPYGDWIEIEPEAGWGNAPRSGFIKGRSGKGLREAMAAPPEPRRFLVPVAASVARGLDLKAPVEIFVGKAKAGQPVMCLAEPLSLPELAQGIGPAVAAMLKAEGRDGLAAILGARISIEPLQIPSRFWLEHLVGAGTGLFANGWMANLADRTVHVVTGDLKTWLFSPSIKPMARPDVHAHLREEGALTSASDEHGFTFVLPWSGEEEAELYFVEVSPDEGDVTFHGPLAMPVKKDGGLAFSIVSNAFGDIRSLSTEEVDSSYRLLLSTPKTGLRAKVFDFGPALPKDKPVSSIIIPFYGDAFFLHCVHYLQRVLDDSFELVLVVDDLRIWNEIYNSISLRSKALRVPTRLLRNHTNYGFGGANNIGVSQARGDVLFLMNSDILVKDPQGLVEAAAAIRDRQRKGGPELLAWFSLLYEDETIQHVGMEFQRSSQVGDLFLADHPLKGLPFAFYQGEAVRNVPAVTGALMALSKDLYTRLGGFDLRYVRGDFEDADLCLRARRLGAEIQLHVRPGLYHLERQSIPAMGDADLRSMVTYMNCAEFNRRWGAELSQPKRVFKVAGRQTPPAGNAKQ